MSDINKADADLQHNVTRELAWDTRVSPADIDVQVSRGVVALRGTVDSWAQFRAADEAAHRVNGVQDVANDLVVQIPGTVVRTDTDLARAVRQVLEWDVMVPDWDIHSTVSQGSVTLSGTVAYGTQRADAERAVEHIGGVTRILNRIDVKPREKADPAQVRLAVLFALERRAERETANLDLQVADGEVTVAGVVHSWREKQAVLGSVRSTRGVRSVHDQLRIQP